MTGGDRRPQPVKGSAHPRRLEQPCALVHATAATAAAAAAAAAAATGAAATGAAAAAATKYFFVAGPSGWKAAARSPLGASLRLLGQPARELML